MPHRKRHLALVLALPILLLLSATPAGALSLERALPVVFADGWSLVHFIWAEIGCMIDPSGTPCLGGLEPILSEGGCSLDPHGGCGQ